MRLADLEADAQLEIPRDIGRAIKMLATDERYATAWQFIIQRLCGVRRLSFMPGRGEAAELMIWFEGRRFVGEQLLRIVETVIPDETPELLPARTMTEKVRRRTARQLARDP